MGNEKEYNDFHKALLAWLNSQDVHPKIAVPVLASVVAHKIGAALRQGFIFNRTVTFANHQLSITPLKLSSMKNLRIGL